VGAIWRYNKRQNGQRAASRHRRAGGQAGLARRGDQFVGDGRAAILIVSSALAPSESNWLINPLHRDFAKIRIHSPEAFQYNPRFFT